MAATPVVGFIGLGAQGAPIAARIALRFPLQVWARRPASAAPLAEAGATIAPDKASLAAACDVVGLCVATDDEVRDVLLGDGGIIANMRPGGTILVHSTVLPHTVIELEAAARAAGLGLLDAPVSGGPDGARAGTMTVMIGGDAATLERVRPVIESFAQNIPLLGPVGAAQQMKLLNNNLTYANLTMGIAALEMARALGIDQRVAASVIQTSSGNSQSFRLLATDVGFGVITAGTNNLRKDIRHFAELAAASGHAENRLTAVARSAPDDILAFAETRFK